MNMPEVPKAEKPKTPIKPDPGGENTRKRARKPAGQDSLISAGKLKTKATTVKSSLLSGGS
jgi:hypothetical protein